MVAFLFIGIKATPEEAKLRVVSKVHSNPDVFVTSKEKRAKRHGHCVDSGSVEDKPVCASNGKKYLNEDVFEFHKCLIQAQFGENIEIVKMEICTSAQKEDNEHPDVPDRDYT
ncbi:Protease inhibitor protein [Plasmopara halstedii]|uniref:Protease inhibitor protein n=1 Tax=Plasmopara halstedii TaxID=4781 RepID=A0A0P1A621_PLAHL|nr:Protease inhibitor protein [Plasmopara halstedii]CEG36013.1 Protease inhibitor protein [Plasmopara halstedii]|eukprot:XP_024572382.1 Protease inhibitor protein [Plasmopara halstedii]